MPRQRRFIVHPNTNADDEIALLSRMIPFFFRRLVLFLSALLGLLSDVAVVVSPFRPSSSLGLLVTRRPRRTRSSIVVRNEAAPNGRLGAATATATAKGDKDDDNRLVDVSSAKQRFQAVRTIYDEAKQAAGYTLPVLDARITDLQQDQENNNNNDGSGRWNKDSTSSVKELSSYMKLRQRLLDWETYYGDAAAALEMLMLTTTSDDEERGMLLHELQSSLDQLHDDCQTAQMEWLVNTSPYDTAPARMLLTAGAGGTEATDWVEMLLRMYEKSDLLRRHNLKLSILDSAKGDETGYKSVELVVTGENAYGWLRGEKGTHRLVRISPFNALNKRQTTFAGVDVYPDLDESLTANVQIDESDLEYSYTRSGGAGGQNVNKVNSAVRLLHKPSGLSVRCDRERSQLMNKNQALSLLKAQLLSIAEREKLATIRQVRGDVVSAGWGTQIRNYVLHPYKLVKDQRTGWETSDAIGFLNGDYLIECTASYLRHRKETLAAMEVENANTNTNAAR
jgi:peptide chain release factor 2